MVINLKVPAAMCKNTLDIEYRMATLQGTKMYIFYYTNIDVLTRQLARNKKVAHSLEPRIIDKTYWSHELNNPNRRSI